MGKACEAVKKAARDFYHFIFPHVIDPPECVRRTIETIYPTIDWNTVTFHENFPWVFRLGGQKAITLPRTYDLHHIDIYFRKGAWDPCSCTGLGTVVHECFHVLQYRDLIDGWGLGYLRPFIIAYLSCSVLGGGGKNNAIEQPTYQQSDRFEACCNLPMARPICDCTTNPPTFDSSALAALIASCPDVVRTSSGLNFWQAIWGCLPGGRWLVEKGDSLSRWGCRFEPTRDNPSDRAPWGSILQAVGRWILLCAVSALGGLLLKIIAGAWYALWLAFWTAVTLGIAVLKPVLEIVLLVVDGLLWVGAGIVCAAEWVWEKIEAAWHWFRARLSDICDWSNDVEKVCSEWEKKKTKECKERRDKGYQQCDDWRDEGSNQCSDWDKRCCDWAPCSWACKALTLVCVAWNWVSNWVCKAAHWVANVVCVLWKIIVTTTCKTFTFVVKGLTCWAK